MRYRLVFALLLNAAASATGFAGEGGPEPFRLMRSLQMVQDRIAAGDREAVALQDDMMPLIERSLGAAGGAIAEDARNRDAFMLYALSGGNAGLIKRLLPALKDHDAEKRMGAAVLLQRSGQEELAAKTAEALKPREAGGEVGAYLAIFKSGLGRHGEEARSIAELDEARLALPGTLVEEAALRRQLTLYGELGDFASVLRTARRYLQRFPASPYAGPAVDAFAAAAAEHAREEDRPAVLELVDSLSADRGRAVLYRFSRAGAVKGRTEFLAWAAQAYGERLGDSASPGERASLAFFRAVAALPSLDPTAAGKRLQDLDSKALGDDERRLLAALRSVLASAPKPDGETKPERASGKDAKDGAGRAEPTGEHPPVAPVEQQSELPPVEEKNDGGEPDDDIDGFVGDMRARLDALDTPAEGQ